MMSGFATLYFFRYPEVDLMMPCSSNLERTMEMTGGDLDTASTISANVACFFVKRKLRMFLEVSFLRWMVRQKIPSHLFAFV
jgi:hypothetical protein